MYMTKYIIGEIFSSGGATLYKNPSDQTVNILPQNVISFFSWVFPSIFKYHSRIERRYYNIYILHYGQFFILNPPKNSVFYGLIYSMHFFSVVIFTHFRFISFDRVAKNQWSTRWIDFYYHALGHLWPKKHSKLT